MGKGASWVLVGFDLRMRNVRMFASRKAKNCPMRKKLGFEIRKSGYMMLVNNAMHRFGSV
ncbi:hypothetical protein IP81_04840 [Novosphingobium sp. AAP83]|nr:hypothetical protein IP81_04840 [Novosphingobium sp. AAP83]